MPPSSVPSTTRRGLQPPDLEDGCTMPLLNTDNSLPVTQRNIPEDLNLQM
jgi:hypothetical protein